MLLRAVRLDSQVPVPLAICCGSSWPGGVKKCSWGGICASAGAAVVMPRAPTEARINNSFLIKEGSFRSFLHSPFDQGATQYLELQTPLTAIWVIFALR